MIVQALAQSDIQAEISVLQYNLLNASRQKRLGIR
jgi:hypothetical protein